MIGFLFYNMQISMHTYWKEKSVMGHQHHSSSTEFSGSQTKPASQKCSTKESIRKVITAWWKCLSASLVLYLYLVTSPSRRVHSGYCHQQRCNLFLLGSRTIPWSPSKIILTSYLSMLQCHFYWLSGRDYTDCRRNLGLSRALSVLKQLSSWHRTNLN
jgi:hypothetical protein